LSFQQFLLEVKLPKETPFRLSKIFHGYHDEYKTAGEERLGIVVDHINSHTTPAKLSNVNTGSLIATQKWLRNTGADPDETTFEGHHNPILLKVGKHHLILDGHHRAAIEHIHSKGILKAHVYELPHNTTEYFHKMLQSHGEVD